MEKSTFIKRLEFFLLISIATLSCFILFYSFKVNAQPEDNIRKNENSY